MIFTRISTISIKISELTVVLRREAYIAVNENMLLMRYNIRLLLYLLSHHVDSIVSIGFYARIPRVFGAHVVKTHTKKIKLKLKLAFWQFKNTSQNYVQWTTYNYEIQIQQ